MKIKSFTNLEAWRCGHKLVLKIYKETSEFPREELYALTDQLRRSSVSITSNIAEGFSRNHTKEKLQFYYTALASLSELQNQLLIAKDVGYVTKERFAILAKETIYANKLINGLIKFLKKNP